MRRLKSVMICASMILAAFVTFIPGTFAMEENGPMAGARGITDTNDELIIPLGEEYMLSGEHIYNKQIIINGTLYVKPFDSGGTAKSGTISLKAPEIFIDGIVEASGRGSGGGGGVGAANIIMEARATAERGARTATAVTAATARTDTAAEAAEAAKMAPRAPEEAGPRSALRKAAGPEAPALAARQTTEETAATVSGRAAVAAGMDIMPVTTDIMMVVAEEAEEVPAAATEMPALKIPEAAAVTVPDLLAEKAEMD